MRMGLFQPFTLLEMAVYYRPGHDLQRLKDARIAVPFEHIPFDVRKSSQAIFLTEILLKCIKEEEPNADLFDFLFHAACLLDMKKEGIANFHLAFLFNLTRFLGVFPQLPGRFQEGFFDLETASFSTSEPFHNQFMDIETTSKFKELFEFELGRVELFSFSHSQRTVLLTRLLEYYRIHLDLTGDIKSLTVLKEVME
jgi:DNA repair protein RecO (recombination protein O)